jgi:shikimate kinase
LLKKLRGSVNYFICLFLPRQVDALRATGVVVYIKRDVEYLIHRTAGDSNRPDLSASQSFREIMERREPFYQQAAVREMK